MTDPRHHTDSVGGRHTTHTPFSLSDSDVSEEDEAVLASFLDELFDDPEEMDPDA